MAVMLSNPKKGKGGKRVAKAKPKAAKKAASPKPSPRAKAEAKKRGAKKRAVKRAPAEAAKKKKAPVKRATKIAAKRRRPAAKKKASAPITAPAKPAAQKPIKRRAAKKRRATPRAAVTPRRKNVKKARKTSAARRKARPASTPKGGSVVAKKTKGKRKGTGRRGRPRGRPAAARKGRRPGRPRGAVGRKKGGRAAAVKKGIRKAAAHARQGVRVSRTSVDRRSAIYDELAAEGLGHSRGRTVLAANPHRRRGRRRGAARRNPIVKTRPVAYYDRQTLREAVRGSDAYKNTRIRRSTRARIPVGIRKNPLPSFSVNQANVNLKTLAADAAIGSLGSVLAGALTRFVVKDFTVKENAEGKKTIQRNIWSTVWHAALGIGGGLLLRRSKNEWVRRAGTATAFTTLTYLLTRTGSDLTTKFVNPSKTLSDFVPFGSSRTLTAKAAGVLLSGTLPEAEAAALLDGTMSESEAMNLLADGIGDEDDEEDEGVFAGLDGTVSEQEAAALLDGTVSEQEANALLEGMPSVDGVDGIAESFDDAMDDAVEQMEGADNKFAPPWES